jgi:hypothetical protein
MAATATTIFSLLIVKLFFILLNLIGEEINMYIDCPQKIGFLFFGGKEVISQKFQMVIEGASGVDMDTRIFIFRSG